QAGNIPALQGAGSRPGERWNVMEANWAPATRLLAVTAGGALFAYGLRERFPVACVLGTAGLALMARGVTNVPLTRFVGAARGRPVRGRPEERHGRGPGPAQVAAGRGPHERPGQGSEA